MGDTVPGGVVGRLHEAREQAVPALKRLISGERPAGQAHLIESSGTLRSIISVRVVDLSDCGDLNGTPVFLAFNDASACGGASVLSISDATSYPMRLDLASRPAEAVVGALAILALGLVVIRAALASWRRSLALGIVLLAVSFLAFVANGERSGVGRYLMPLYVVVLCFFAPSHRRTDARPWWAGWTGCGVAVYVALAILGKLLR
jgi:hypothetical protein